MSTFTAPREGEIDLFAIVRALFRRWRLICISALSCTALGLAAAFLLPKQYQASSIVLLTRPEVVLQFDPRVYTSYESPPSTTLPALSLSDRVLDELLRSQAASDLRQGEDGIDALRKRLSATAAEMVLRLTVEGTDPDRVAALANGWTAITVRLLNDIYDPRAGAREAFTASAQQAAVDWRAAQEALASFQAHNPERVLATRLATLERELASLQENEAQLGQALQDIRALESRIGAMDGSAVVDPRDGVMSLLLAIRTIRTDPALPRSAAGQEDFSGGDTVRSGVPDEVVQVNAAFPLESVLNQTAAQHIDYLRALAESMEAQRALSREEGERLEGEIPPVQGQLAEAVENRRRLEIERDLSQELYETLSRSVQESLVAAGSTDDVFLVASPALPPTRPAGPRKALITFIAGCVGLAVGVVSALGLEWWRSEGRSDREADARTNAETV